MRLANHLILLLALLFAAVLPGSAAAQTDDVPYLYYYSREFNAFLIERADGTDRHWLGQGLARENASNIDGPGWSPSGLWFAWTENRFTTEQDHGNNPFVIHADGTRRLTLLDDFNDAVMAWAPGDDDVLLIVGTKNELVGESDTIVYMLLVDMATETVLNAVDVQRPARKYYLSFEPEEVHYLRAARLVVDWMPDGERAVVYLEGTTDYDGNELAPDALYILDLVGGVEIGPTTSTYADQIVSARGFVAYRDENGQLVLENILSGQREIVTVEGGFYFARMRWSPDGRYLLARGSERGLYLIETTDFTVTLLAERGSLETYARYGGPVEYWSPGSDYVVFAAQSAETPTISYLYLYEIATQNTTQLPVKIDFGDPTIELGSWYWTGPDEVTFAMWRDADWVWEFTRYQVSTGSAYTVSTSGQQNSLFPLTTAYLSPGGQYIVYCNEVVGFQDVQTGDQLIYPPDSRSYFSMMDSEVDWYAGGTWAILYEDAGIAGGGEPYWTGVARPDGSLRRELGWCSGRGQQCIGWLPPQVDVNTLPLAPVLHDMTEPVLELAGTHWNYYLNWSPDGTHLVAGADGHGYGMLAVWNLAERRVVESIAVDESTNFKDYDILIEWQPDYTLRVTPGDPIGAPRTYSPDGRFYVDTHYDSVGVYDVSTDVMLHPLDIGNFSYTLSFTNDGRFLAVIHDEFPAYLLDTKTWETVLTFDTHATAAAFSPDNKILALANGWNVQLWDMRAFYDSIGYESAD
jgi:WD40 repeat protein